MSQQLLKQLMLALDSPKSVFIMGGGEGSTAREALRHRSVEEVVMCDIDEVSFVFRPCPLFGPFSVFFSG